MNFFLSFHFSNYFSFSCLFLFFLFFFLSQIFLLNIFIFHFFQFFIIIFSSLFSSFLSFSYLMVFSFLPFLQSFHWSSSFLLFSSYFSFLFINFFLPFSINLFFSLLLYLFSSLLDCLKGSACPNLSENYFSMADRQFPKGTSSKFTCLLIHRLIWNPIIGYITCWHQTTFSDSLQTSRDTKSCILKNLYCKQYQ